MTKEEIKERIEAYEEIINDPFRRPNYKRFCKKESSKTKRPNSSWS